MPDELLYELVDIESVECIGEYDNEAVYDMEVENYHTFFANEILVHNSIYVEFNRIIRQLGIPFENELQFTIDLWNKGLGPYMERKYEEYAEMFGCPENKQVLEMEKIATTAIMVAKKHYSMMEGWKEPNVYMEPGEDVIYKGLELIQGSCPKFVRECQADFYTTVHMWYHNHNEPMGFDELFKKLKKYKAEFLIQHPQEISKSMSVSDYNKFIANDQTGIVVDKHCPIHVRAAAIFNYFLNQNPKYKAKYNRLKTRDKVKWYYTTDPEYPVFAFKAGEYPVEFALPVDYNKQFDNLILKPLNKILAILNHPQLPPELCYSTALF